MRFNIKSMILIVLVSSSLVSNVFLYLQFNDEMGKLREEDRVTKEALNSFVSQLSNQTSRIDNVLDVLDVLNGTLRLIEGEGNLSREQIEFLKMNFTKLYERVSALEFEIIQSRLDIISIREEIIRVWASIKGLNERIENINKPSYWNSMSELRSWLASDTTDKQTFIPVTHDCDDFALDLSLKALEDRKFIYPFPVILETNETFIWENPIYPECYLINRTVVGSIFLPRDRYWRIVNHWIDLTYCNDVGWVVIEPQRDWVVVLGQHEL